MNFAGRRIFHPFRRLLASTSSSSDLYPGRWPRSAKVSSGTSVGKMAHYRAPICAEVVREMYDKMFGSLEARTMPANAWLWSLVSNCSTKEDVTLLFKMLENLRIFRLSNLRIPTNFNDNLCQSVAEACVRSSALDYGKKTLWKHNTYGLTPTIASAHHLLLHAKKQKDVKLMVDVIKLLKKNDLPLQPGTADIVFSICSDLGEWGLLSKYAKKFTRAGVKLRRTSFGTWMEFAARRGDLESLWKIEELRLKMVKQHNLATGFSCVKGYLLEGKPNDAAALIHMLYQNMSEQLKLTVVVELQKLTSEWPLDVIKQQNKEDRKAMAASLRSEIKKMIGTLSNLDRLLSVSTEDILREEAIPL